MYYIIRLDGNVALEKRLVQLITRYMRWRYHIYYGNISFRTNTYHLFHSVFHILPGIYQGTTLQIFWKMKWSGPQATFVHIQAKLGQENLMRMVRWVRWHCPPEKGFEIQPLEVWGRARYLSVTEAPHNTEFHEWMGKKHLCFFQTAVTKKWTPNASTKGSGANHYPRAPAQIFWKH